MIHVEALADCPLSVADEYAAAFLRAGEPGAADESAVRVPVRLFGSRALRRQVAMHFALRCDCTDPGRRHDEMALSWSSRSRLLPDFSGTVRFRIAGELTRVLVEGAYVPPGGVAGALFDALIGRRIARATLQDLADRLAAELTRGEAAWRRERRLAPP